MRWQDISSNLFNVCAFKNSIGEVLPKIYFKSQVEKLSFLIQALQSIKANKNYSSFMVWHLTHNPNIQELFSLIFTHNISTKDYLFLIFFLFNLDVYFCNPPCAHLASRNSNICKKFQLSPTILQNLILQKQKHK